MKFIKSTARLAKRILPASLYAYCYRHYFRFKVKVDKQQSISVLSEREIPPGNSKRVKFQLTAFTSSSEILESITGDILSQFSSFQLFTIRSSTENNRCICLYGNKDRFNEGVRNLICKGFRISIGGQDHSNTKGNFYNLSFKNQSPVSLYKVYCSSKGATVFQSEIAIDIHLLEQIDSRTLTCPSDNYCFKTLDLSALENSQFQTMVKQTPEFDFDVDVVITWVDGDDPSWAKKKDRYASTVGKTPVSSMSANRYQSRDELKYCIRSILTYAPWVRNIYLVTDNQVPEWFCPNEKVCIVDHTQIFVDKDMLPVFNSHAIESNLHRIEGLSENFLYFNDDVLLRRPVSKSDFFSPFGRQSKFFYSSAAFIPTDKNDDLLPVDFAALNNARLLEALTGFRPLRKFQHTPIALKKSNIEALESAAPEIFTSTAHSRFRAFTDYSIVSALAHYYGYYSGTAQPSKIRYTYINLGDETAHLRVERLLHNDQNFSCICINDVDHTNESELAYLGEILGSIYCQKSIAEA